MDAEKAKLVAKLVSHIGKCHAIVSSASMVAEVVGSMKDDDMQERARSLRKLINEAKAYVDDDEIKLDRLLTDEADPDARAAHYERGSPT